MSTDFENNIFEKNAITNGKPVGRWKDSKSYISGIFNPVKLKFLQAILNVVYFHLKKRNRKKSIKIFSLTRLGTGKLVKTSSDARRFKDPYLR